MMDVIFEEQPYLVNVYPGDTRSIGIIFARFCLNIYKKVGETALCFTEISYLCTRRTINIQNAWVRYSSFRAS